MVWPRNLPKSLNLWLASSHITSTVPRTLLNRPKHFKLEAGECLSSYDVSALFTSVPIDPALNIIKDLLDKGQHPQGKNSHGSWGHYPSIGILSQNTYFSFQGQFYEQVEGAAMGSPVSPM